MSAIKKNNTTLALAIAAALTATSSQAALLVSAHPNASVLLNNSLLLASTSQVAMSAFWNGKYTYCDAKTLAAYWDQPIFEAKSRAGEKLLNGENGILEGYLARARTRAQDIGQPTCTYNDEGYSYEDAAILAEYWGKSTPWDAKLKMNRLLAQGSNAAIQKDLQQVKQQQNKEQSSLDAFWEQYTICDAKVLAAYWEQPILEAKARAGEKLLLGAREILEDFLTEARTKARNVGNPACAL